VTPRRAVPGTGLSSSSSRSSSGRAQEHVRRHNLGTLLGHLHLDGPLSRAELAALMGLNRSTIGALVSELAALGAVGEESPVGARSGVGRPSLVVRPAPGPQALVADIGVDRIVVARVGLGGRVAARVETSLPASAHSPAEVADRLLTLAAAIPVDPAAGDRVVGIGVSVPGAVRRADGLVRFAPNLGWADAPLGELLTQRAPGLTVRVANDADLGLLGEHRRGAARGYDDVVFIAGEIGVGGGLIVGGLPMTGSGGYAGEVGHMRVRPKGRRCRCGGHGCWETEIGAEAIRRALDLPLVSSVELARALREPGVRDSGALDRVAHYLGLGLANIINVVNPRLVILGGLLREVFTVVPEAVRASVRASTLTAPGEHVLLRVSELGGDAILLGTAELVLQDLLDDPAGVLGATEDPLGDSDPREG
jgi:predicted NBD/HSP70 family sugar kinase